MPPLLSTQNCRRYRPARLSNLSGFSLVEMLVVVAVLLLLAALTMGAMGRVQESGKQASTASRLRQVHVHPVAGLFTDRNPVCTYAEAMRACASIPRKGWQQQKNSLKFFLPMLKR